MTQKFIGDDGRVPEWLQRTDDGQPLVEPDKYGAFQLIHASLTLEPAEFAHHLDRVLRERPAVPLLGGLVMAGEALAKLAFRDAAGPALEQLTTKFAVEEAIPALEDEERQ